MLTAGSIVVTVFGILIVCYSVLYSGGDRRESLSLRYSVVVEGGSTVSRIHVFEKSVRAAKYASFKMHPGLSAYAHDPHGASLQLNEIEVRLMVTTGMRLLELPVQEKILQVARRVLQSSGFMFRDEWASVISGSEDVVKAWLVTNLALGSLGGTPLATNLVNVIEASRSMEHVFDQIKAGDESKLCLWRMCWPKAWRVGLF